MPNTGDSQGTSAVFIEFKTKQDSQKNQPEHGIATRNGGLPTQEEMERDTGRPGVGTPVMPVVEGTLQCGSQVVGHPHHGSLFLDGRVAGKIVKLLIDTGCTTNLLSKTLFDRLAQNVRQQLVPPEAEHGLTADGSPLRFYGRIQVNCKVSHLHWSETFIVSQIKDEVILGMPFLLKQQCQLSFPTGELEVPSGKLQCVDKEGHPTILIKQGAEKNQTQFEYTGQVTTATTPKTEIATLQRTDAGPVGQIYNALATGETIPERQYAEGSPELKTLVNQWDSLFIDEQGTLRTTIHKTGRDTFPAICPSYSDKR